MKERLVGRRKEDIVFLGKGEPGRAEIKSGTGRGELG